MTRAIAGPLKVLLSVSASIALALTAGRAMAGSPGCKAPEYRQRVWYRVRWTSQDVGVREIAVVSKDGGRSWRPAFDILFVKAPAG